MSKIISTVFGIGYCPIAPGTAGSLFALLIYWFVPTQNPSTFLAIIFVFFFVGVFTSTRTEDENVGKYGPVGVDPGIVVVDEVVGMLIAVFMIPKTLTYLIASFVLFRLFDIMKPFPINKIQNLKKGWGIMMDDVVAGVYANLLVQIFCGIC